MVKKNKVAQSLIEVLIALGIGVLVIVALVQSLVTSVKNSQFAKNQSLATRYSQDAMEKVRSERDALGWTGMLTAYNAKTYCLGSGTSASWTVKSGTCPVISGTVFTREATFNDGGSGTSLLVEITTSWTDGAGNHQSKQSTYLTKWQ